MSDKSGKRGNFDVKDWYKDAPVSGQCAEDLLASARLKLLMDFPFFGKIAQNMALIETDMVPTTAVDPKGRLYYNRKWVNHFELDDAVFEFAHEVGHLYQRCFERKPDGANHGFWNKAADWRADTDLIDAGLTQSKVSVEAVGKFEQDKTRELETIPAIYKWMLQNAEENTDCPACKQMLKQMQSMENDLNQEMEKENKQINQNGNDESEEDGEGGESDSGEPNAAGGGGSGHGHGLEHTCGNVRQCCVGSTADLAQATPMDEQKWTEIVIAAKMHAEGKGNMPGRIGEKIDQLTKSTVRWQDYLKTKSAKIFGRDRYSYRRYNRRGACMKVRLPRALPDGKTAVVGADTSGSMSQKAVRQAITESAAIMKACGASKIWLILHDMVPYFSGYVTDADLTNLKISRGGTSHEGVFQILNQTHENSDFNIPKEEDVELAILFTDLGTDFPDEKPNFDVIWGVPSDGCPGMNADVPFGTKVPVEMGE